MAEKLLKTDPLVNYRYAADPAKSCGRCVHYRPTQPAIADQESAGGCELVEGAIRAIDSCNLWAPKAAKQEAKRRRKHEDAMGSDAQFPTPKDAWSEDEDEDEGAAGSFRMDEDDDEDEDQDEGEAWPDSAWRHAEAAVDALHGAGWRPVTKEALRWRHPKLQGHEIEVARGSWTHGINGIVHHAGGHHQLAGHVKSMSKLYRAVEAERDFNRLLDLQD